MSDERLSIYWDLLAESLERAGGPLRELAAAMQDGLARAVQHITDTLAPLLTNDYQVPPHAQRVRPVGRKSNSRDWLAWDSTRACWRPCYRTRGGDWWWR